LMVETGAMAKQKRGHAVPWRAKRALVEKGLI
jgi:hypothetical protein